MALQTGKTVDSRRAQLEGKLTSASEPVKAKILKDFGRMNFVDDTDFGDFLTQTEADVKTLTQTAANTSLIGMGVPRVGQAAPAAASVTADIAAWGQASKPAAPATAK